MKISDNKGFIIPKTSPPKTIDPHEIEKKIEYLKTLLTAQQAVVIAHYYTPPELQELAEQSGGFVGDSLAMAQFGYQHPAKRLIVVGVRFMGESAKILSPEKQVLMPTLEATCSLDLGCPAEAFSAFCDAHPEREVVVYANTSAAVKARADWVVTSSNAVAIVDYLSAQGKKIVWAPDRYLGRYVQLKTEADMILWNGVCVVHAEFQATGIEQLKKQYPQAAVLVHPEAPEAVIELADVVGSTTVLLKASQQLDNTVFIVATDRGLFYQMQKISPNKQFIAAPTAGQGATCHSCAYCPWMAMNNFENLEASLSVQANEIVLDEEIIEKARRPLQRMIHFQEQS